MCHTGNRGWASQSFKWRLPTITMANDKSGMTCNHRIVIMMTYAAITGSYNSVEHPVHTKQKKNCGTTIFVSKELHVAHPDKSVLCHEAFDLRLVYLGQLRGCSSASTRIFFILKKLSTKQLLPKFDFLHSCIDDIK